MIRRFSLALVLAVAAATAAGAQDRTAYRATELIQRWRIIINTIFEERRASQTREAERHVVPGRL